MQYLKENFSKCLIIFMIYSLIGWCWEEFLLGVIQGQGYTDRGVLLGPYCLIYGIGALIVILILWPLKKKEIKFGKINISPILIFFLCSFIFAILELASSYIMELFYNHWDWDYSNLAFDYEGRIAPLISLGFGLGGVIIIYLIQPLVTKILNKLNQETIKTIATFLTFLLFIDLIYTIIT